ncbi:thioredoxin-disulfide reductase [Fundicoccus culcitae]|uniref:Thioredoxin reductase n=1 Tax=Fundicoccus culcitae TaxID=2969821 RepID=A0ABY5PAG8_9LACT|nr:thioredoxin-disulfide reductase [Fundicoccus culcitae]UUX35493.1 thioredoxin-disulfide reductase [Fundicoccus culcitae]
MTAALYASRSNLKTIIIEKGAPGGELINTADVENYPGFKLISGPDLATQMYESSLAFGAEHVYGDVSHIDIQDGIKHVHTADKIYLAPVVIIATGSHHRKLGVKGEEKLSGQGVSYCAVCDGFFFRNRELVVVGGGDSAVEEGNYLTQFANKVTIVHRRDELRAQKVLQDRAFNNPKVEFIWDSVVEEIKGDLAVDAVQIRNIKTNEVYDYKTNGVFIYIGLVPNSAIVEGLGITDDEGWIITNESMETGIPGLYAVGDVRQKHLRQIATAVGDGSHAGHMAYQYIESLKDQTAQVQ